LSRLFGIFLFGLLAACAGPGATVPLERYILFFEPDSEEIHTLARGVAAQAASDAQARAGSRLTVTGFASAGGDAAANLALSERRARGVASLLVAAGVRPEFVSAAGRGEDLEASEANYGRRVVIERYAP
jgi:outer membrane protein OmpA-like peptidoglycan-associated protein